MNAPNVISVRNNTLVQYFDVSCLDIQRNGCVASLKQNSKSIYKDTMKQLDKVLELPEKYNDITEFSKSYQSLYNSHKLEQKKKEIDVKPMATMSKMQIKSCKKAIENLISLVLLNYDKKKAREEQQYLTFVTLTLPIKQRHTDKVLRKCLVRFIENLTRVKDVQHYIWKAEPQKNGNIHFHVLIDRSVPNKEIQRLWNNQLNTLDYIDDYKAKNRTLSEPPTTDIHSLKNVKNTAHYLMKYMTKNETYKRLIVGKLWGCANVTKRLEYPSFYESESFFNDLLSMINKKEVKAVILEDYFSVYAGKVYDIIRKSYRYTWYAIRRHFQRIKKFTTDSYKSFENKVVSVEKSELNSATLFLSDLKSKTDNIKEFNRIESNKRALLRQKEKELLRLHKYNPSQTDLFNT